MAEPTFGLNRVLRNSTLGAESASILNAIPKQRLTLIVIGAIFALLGVCACLLRIMTLLQRRRGPWWDDFAAFGAFTFFVAFASAAFVSVRWGVGFTASDVPSWWVPDAVQAGYAAEILYFFCMFCIKSSILLLYLRLAKALRSTIRWLCIGLVGILTIEAFVSIIVASAQCVPTHKYWNPAIEGHCINVTAFLYANNIFTIVTDLVILALPLPTILRVKRQRAQNVSMIFAFTAGGLSIAASCVRLYSTAMYASSNEPLRDAAPIYTWSFIEISAGLCCASVAVITPLFTAYSVRLSAIISPVGPPDGMHRFTNCVESWPYGRMAPMGRYVPAEIQGESRRTTESLTDRELPHDINGQPIRISKPLPALPKPCCQGQGLTALPQRPSQPMLYAIAAYKNNNVDPRAPVFQSRVREQEVRELEGAGMW